MKSKEDIFNWAYETLTAAGYIVDANPELVVDPAWSCVYRLNTNSGVIYLKQVPEILALEAATIQLLRDNCGAVVPEVIASNDTLHCFMMRSCGDISLRQWCDDQIEVPLVAAGLSEYTAIQRTFENKIDQLFALGIPDWRLNVFPALYEELINHEALLLNDGLKPKEVEQLKHLMPQCVELCEKLEGYAIPQTLDHCDLHDNNMLFDQSSQTICIIDWGEVVVTHPFFSLNGCLWNLKHFHQISTDSEAYASLRLQAIKSWRDVLSEDELLSAFDLATQLSGAYAALAYERLYCAIGDAKRGAIAGCLRTFLSLQSG